jgi:hypothetical protein
MLEESCLSICIEPTVRSLLGGKRTLVVIALTGRLLATVY